MMLSRARVVAACIALGLLPAIYCSLNEVQRQAGDEQNQERIYITSPQILKKLSLGYNGLLADIYWTRVVQYFGYHHHTDHQYQLLKPLLEITTGLDSHLVAPYELGAIFLSQKPPEGAGDPDTAVSLVKRGIKQNPNYWRLYYHLGYIEYLEKKDYRAAAQAFEDGSRVPGAHPWMHIMAAQMEHNAGDIETAKFLWQNVYDSTEDPSIKTNAANHLIALKVDQDVQTLQGMVTQYRERTGRVPGGFQDLVNVGMMRGIPLDPLHVPYKLESGKVLVQDSSRFPFIQQGLH